MPRPRPLSPEGVADHLAETIGGWSGDHPLRVAIDGAPAAGTGRLVDDLLERLPAVGRSALRVDTQYFLRPASIRFEHGKTDPDAYFEDRLDADALRREVLDPAGPGGTGLVLPTLWDPVTDRATRADYRALPASGVVLVDGPLLLGRGLPFDLTVHLRLSAGALTRRTPEDEHWMLPAFARYEREVAPVRAADVVVFTDDARRPALLT